MDETGVTAVQPSLEDPEIYRWLRHMRDHHPVSFDETIGMWKIFRYDDVVRVLSDPATFSSELFRVLPGIVGQEANLVTADPPRHRRLRALVNKVFTPAMVARLAPRISAVCAELLDGVAEHGAMDFVEEIAYPLPATVIAEVLGVPPSGREVLRRCMRGLFSLGTGDLRDEAFTKAAAAVQQELIGFLGEHVRDRQRNPGDDLVSRLVLAEVDGCRLDEGKVVDLSNILLVAGHATTTLVLASVLLTLDRQPAAMAALRADNSLVPKAIEEVMRYRSVQTAKVRLTTKEVEVRGQTIPAGQLVLASTLSANRDERRFRDPDRFDIYRDPNPHIAFGYGIHYCLGAPLARLEARIATEQILQRFKDIRLDHAAAPVFQESFGMFGPKSLPVVFTLA